MTVTPDQVLITEWCLTTWSVIAIALQLCLRKSIYRAGIVVASASGAWSLLRAIVTTVMIVLSQRGGNNSLLVKLGLVETIIYYFLLLSIKAAVLVVIQNYRRTASGVTNSIAFSIIVFIPLFFLGIFLEMVLWCHPWGMIWAGTCDYDRKTTSALLLSWNVSSDVLITGFLLYLARTTYKESPHPGTRLLVVVALEFVSIAAACASFATSLAEEFGDGTTTTTVCERVQVTAGITANFVLLVQFDFKAGMSDAKECVSRAWGKRKRKRLSDDGFEFRSRSVDVAGTADDGENETENGRNEESVRTHVDGVETPQDENSIKGTEYHLYLAENRKSL